MFSLKNNLKFITINQDYLKYLHSFCSEVYYKPTGYETKPYIGILVQENDSYKARLVYTEVNLNPAANDTKGDKKYKVLLNIEYTFCLKIMNSIIQKASKLYEKQMTTGKVVKFCCDFKLLEEKCREYKSK